MILAFELLGLAGCALVIALITTLLIAIIRDEFF